MNKALKKLALLLFICLISALILAVTFFVYDSVLDFIDSTHESKQNSAYADAVNDAYKYICGTSWAVWFLLFLPISSFLLAKKQLSIDPAKHMWSFVYAVLQSVTYFVAALFNRDLEFYSFAFIVFAWCLIWSQLGFSERPLFLRKLIALIVFSPVMYVLMALIDSSSLDGWGKLGAGIYALGFVVTVLPVLFSIIAAGHGKERFIWYLLCPISLITSMTFYRLAMPTVLIFFGFGGACGLLGLIRSPISEADRSLLGLGKILIYRSGINDPYRNLAIEEYLTAHNPKHALTLFLWQNEDSVVIGKNQNSRAECRADRLKADGANLVRRMSGGGAVWHDSGNLCFSFIANRKYYDVERQLSVIVDACRALGIDAVPDGRNDIIASGAKFSGNAFYKIGENLCHHGTILISSELGRLSEYLTVDPGKLKAKGIGSVRSRVVNLEELCPGLTVGAFKNQLAEAASRVYGLEPDFKDAPTGCEIDARAAFFARDEWIFGEDPEFSDEVFGRFAWGGVKICHTVSKCRIASCRVYTDSLDESFAESVESALTGVEYTPKAIKNAVRELPNGEDISNLFK